MSGTKAAPLFSYNSPNSLTHPLRLTNTSPSRNHGLHLQRNRTWHQRRRLSHRRPNNGHCRCHNHCHRNDLRRDRRYSMLPLWLAPLRRQAASPQGRQGRGSNILEIMCTTIPFCIISTMYHYAPNQLTHL